MKQTYVTMYRIKSNFKLKIHYHDQFHGFFKLVVFANSSWLNWNFKGFIQWYITNKSCKKENKELISTDHESWLNESYMPFHIKSPNKIWGFFSTFKAVKPTKGRPSRPDPLFETWGLTVEPTFRRCWKLPVLRRKPPRFLRFGAGSLALGRGRKQWVFCPWRYKDRNGARLSNWRDGCICQKSLIKSTYTKICDSQLHGHSWPFYA